MINQLFDTFHEALHMRQAYVLFECGFVFPLCMNIKKPRIASGAKRVDTQAAGFLASRIENVAYGLLDGVLLAGASIKTREDEKFHSCLTILGREFDPQTLSQKATQGHQLAARFSVRCLARKLELLYLRTNIIQHSRGRFRILRFGVDAQHSLGSGSAHEHPALSLEIEFLPVQVFAAFDLPFEQFGRTRGIVFDGFFFLAVAQFQINAAIVMLAKFRVQHFHQFA